MKAPGFLRSRSLTYKLLAGTLSVLSAYVAVIGVLAYLSTKDSIAGSYDQSLIINANALLFIMQEEANRGGLEKPFEFNVSPDDLKGEEKDIFAAMSEYRMLRVWYKSKLVLNSNDDAPASVPPFPEGFSDQRLGRAGWRVYSLQAPQKDLVIELGEQHLVRQYLVLSITKDLVIPFVVSFPLVGFLFWSAIRSGMHDLSRVARQVNTRTPEQMTPLDTANLPPDLLPLVEAINALLERLDRSLLRERQITELAAHELRTPLTAIKLQAQLGLKAAAEEGRVSALNGLLEGVERASYLVEQILTLTRVEQTQFELYELDACDIAERACEELAPLSERRGQHLLVQLSEPLNVRANEDLLYLTLRNLIDNALKYSPENSNIAVRGERHPDRIIIDVIDRGPGIPDAIREKIFERFFRYHKGKVIGSGLGLTIARECAEHMNASLCLLTPGDGPGLCARLSFRLVA
jgi:two-component system, OmpR family, sensor histidine kinase QseC